MSLRFIDSCDHYASGDLTEKYHFNNAATVQAGQGRRGTACLVMNGGSTWCSLTLDAQPRWTVGLALRFQGWSPPGTPGTFLELAESSARQVWFDVSPEGFVRVARPSGGSTVVLGVSAQALHTHIWYYVEVSVLSHQAAGEATVRVDGVPWLTLTGVNTQPTVGVLPNQIRLGAPGLGGLSNSRVDDIYICDGQGSGTFTTFLGDCRVDALYPNADGTHTDWTPSAGTAHYAVVEEHPPNDDTDYVYVTTGGTRDSYQLEPLPTMPNPEVLAVQACVSARKEDVDEIVLNTLLVSGGITSLGSTHIGTHEVNAGYKYALDLWTADPNGGVAWTEASVNSLQVGVERI